MSNRTLKIQRALVMYNMLHPERKPDEVAGMDKDAIYGALTDEGYVWDRTEFAWRKRVYRKASRRASVTTNQDWRVILVRVIGHPADIGEVQADMITAFELVGYIANGEPKRHILTGPDRAVALYFRLKKGSTND